MTNKVSVWEDNFRQPQDENITNELNRLSTQVATTNARVLTNEASIANLHASSTVSLLNGWTTSAGANQAPLITRSGKVVVFTAVVTAPGVIAWPFASIPPGFRPSANVTMMFGHTGGGIVLAFLDSTNGNINSFAGSIAPGNIMVCNASWTVP